MIKLFLKFEISKINKYFKAKALAKVITSLLFMVVFAFIAVGIYFFFVSGFRYIQADAMDDIRLALTLFLYEFFLLILAGIVVFSSLISGIFNLFRSDYNNWVISSPGYKLFPRLVLFRSLSASLLPLLVMFLPAVLALHKVYHFSIFGLFFITASVVLFLLLLNALTLLSIILVSYFYYKISQIIKKIPFNFKGLIALLLLLVSSTVATVWHILASIDLVTLFKVKAESSSVSLSEMAIHFKYLPTHPFAMEIVNWQTGEIVSALFNFSLLLLLAVVSSVAWWYVSPLFYPLWQKFQEGNAGIVTSNDKKTADSRVYLFNGNLTTVLFKKELLTSTRNWKGILWFFFLLFIWLMQIGANLILNHNIVKHQHDISQKIITLQVIQYVIAIYFISSFTLRFVFPSFSLEKKTAWILASAPLSFRKIFFGKYFFYSSFFVVVGIVMNYINSIILKVPVTHTLYSMVLFVSVIIFIVTMGLSLGAIFPNRETDDPETISTSMPGLFFTALALIYGALSDWVLYVTLLTGNPLRLTLFISATILLIAVFLVKTPQLVKNKLAY
jgi:hypothetical protein